IWRYADLRGHWDELRLVAWVGHGTERRVYQDGTLADFLSLDTELEELQRWGYTGVDETVVFGGTLATIGGLDFATHFAVELIDPRRDGTLSCTYEVERE